MKEDINDATGNQGQAAGEHETDTGIAGSLKKLDGKGLKGRRNRVIPRMKEKIRRSRKPGLTKKAGKESFDAVAKELLSNKVIVAQYSEGVRQRIIGMYHCGNCQKAD